MRKRCGKSDTLQLGGCRVQERGLIVLAVMVSNQREAPPYWKAVLIWRVAHHHEAHPLFAYLPLAHTNTKRISSNSSAWPLSCVHLGALKQASPCESIRCCCCCCRLVALTELGKSGPTLHFQRATCRAVCLFLCANLSSSARSASFYSAPASVCSHECAPKRQTTISKHRQDSGVEFSSSI